MDDPRISRYERLGTLRPSDEDPVEVRAYVELVWQVARHEVLDDPAEFVRKHLGSADEVSVSEVEVVG